MKKLNKNFYTPVIEDIKVGYECEVKPINESMNWFSGVLKFEKGYRGEGLFNLNPFWFAHKDGKYGPVKIQIFDIDHIRTPYLNKEQIEKEGWKYKKETSPEERKKYSFEKDNLFLLLDLEFSIPIISLIFKDPSIEENYRWLNSPELFKITIPCPSINEFRFINKLLKIE